MSGWVLFQHGRRRPPRSGGRRIAVAIVVFAVSAALLPFVVIGIVSVVGLVRERRRP